MVEPTKWVRSIHRRCIGYRCWHTRGWTEGDATDNITDFRLPKEAQERGWDVPTDEFNSWKWRWWIISITFRVLVLFFDIFQNPVRAYPNFLLRAELENLPLRGALAQRPILLMYFLFSWSSNFSCYSDWIVSLFKAFSKWGKWSFWEHSEYLVFLRFW